MGGGFSSVCALLLPLFILARLLRPPPARPLVALLLLLLLGPRRPETLLELLEPQTRRKDAGKPILS